MTGQHSSAATPVDVIVELLAAAGHRLPLPALREHPLLAGSDLASVLDEAERSGWLVVGADQMVEAGPSAPEPRLTALTRARHRAALGRLLDERFVVPFLTWIGHRLAGLLAEPDPAVVVEAIAMAGERHRRGLTDEAVQVYRMVLEALDAGAPGEHHRVEALVGLSVALRWSGHGAEAEQVRVDAMERARRTGDPEQLALVALSGHGDTISVDDDPSRLALVDHALEALDRSDHRRRAQLLSQRAERSLFVDLDLARRSALEAVELARTSGDANTLVRSLYSLRFTHWHPRFTDSTLVIANEMVAAGPSAPLFGEFGAVTRLQVFFERGDFEHFDGELAAMQRRLDHGGGSFERLWAATFAAAGALVRGEWAGVDGHLAAATALTAGFRYDILDQLILGQQMLMGWHRGADLRSLVTSDVLPAGPLRAAWTACLLGLTAPTLSADVLERRLADHLRDGVETVRDDLTWGPVMGCLAMAAATARSTAHAAMLADAIAPYAEQWAATSGTISFGPFAWHLGRLLRVLGDNEAAAALFDRAIESTEAAGASPWLARVLVSSARLDPDRAVEHAPVAVRLAEELGMPVVLESAQQALGKRPRRALPGGLTEREAEILGMVAQGLSNRDIAEHAFLSVKTVERHLLNAYGKIGVRNRTEATAFVLRHGLAE